ncbi:FG-GAP repeat domain-containing protein [Vibrio campbellii]|uniref:FG-GAP repeat domain-containing protein n=1 Tax=Vibrio campbellii TaxID=680 RepID=UPI00142D3D07|nr:VCBS repeat-containing protein [Vibrio campbellii]NIY90203.1 VCBS repeat-containing protein [Vibrio campbellii]NVK70261.1 VCBS repeat-containing protein [Vibrio campbellii]
MKNTKLALTLLASTILVGCGGGGGGSSAPKQPTTTTPPAATVNSVFQDVENKFRNNAFTRYDILEDGLMVVYSAKSNKELNDTVLVDYSDLENVTYTDIGPGTYARATVYADLDADGVKDIYAVSHGDEIGDSSTWQDGYANVMYFLGTGESRTVGEGTYTHGACAGDFNGDALTDIVDVNAYKQKPVVRYGTDLTATDVPVEMLENPNEYTACLSADINYDGYDDVVFGRNYEASYSDDVASLPNNHFVLLGSAQGLVYDADFEQPSTSMNMFNQLPATVAMHELDGYVVAFVTDYYTTQVELLEPTGNGLVHVDTLVVEREVLDVFKHNDALVVTNTPIDNLSEYYTNSALHITVVNGELVSKYQSR